MSASPTQIEPCFFDHMTPTTLASLAVDIQREAGELGRSLNTKSAAELANLVRLMNCYYSNLIEGHNTRPKDIQNALDGIEIEPERRSLALEAKAHIHVQRTIDEAYLQGTLPSPASIAFITKTHHDFYIALPEELRCIKKQDGSTTPITPGRFRQSLEDDVAVGRHVPPESASIAGMMAYFSQRYDLTGMASSNRIIAIASAHHRLNYIHPFPDGNGRVSRLMSHAMCQATGIGSIGLWSISRGLARGLQDKAEYKQMMDHADTPRQGDLDGRGNLSTSALKDFCEWFLSVVLDQIRFSKAIFNLDGLESRYRRLLQDITDDKYAPDLIAAVLRHGTLDRGDARLVIKASERTARNTLSQLQQRGFLRSDSPKTPVRVAFPLDYRERLFPNLFADAEFTAPAAVALPGQ